MGGTKNQRDGNQKESRRTKVDGPGGFTLADVWTRVKGAERFSSGI